MIRHDPTASEPSEPLTSQNVERGDDAFRNYDRFSQFQNGHSFGLQTFASLRKRVPAAGKTLHKRKILYNRKKGSFLDLSRPLGRSSSPPTCSPPTCNLEQEAASHNE